MSIPQKVADQLSDQGIDYQVIDPMDISPVQALYSADGTMQHQSVQLIVLRDSIAPLQVLLPKDCMLDLQKLCDDTGRTLEALSPQEHRSLAKAHGVDTVTPIPLIGTIPAIVDQRLTLPESLFLEMNDAGQCIQLPQSQFSKLIQNADVKDFCVPLSNLKPHSNDREAIENSVKKFTQMRIQRRLEETLEMPPLPETAERIIQLRIDPNAGVDELAALVEKDPSLAAQVVSWASSPYYAAPGAIKSVHDAVVRVLGFDLVINLALGLALGSTLSMPKDGPHGVIPFWQQAVFSAAMMEGLVKATKTDYRPSIGLAYLCGLLSNYGYLILSHTFPPYFSNINRHIEANPHINSFYVEQHIINVDRETLCSQLMECWSMPEEVVVGLRWQHYPDFIGEHNEYTRLLYISNQMLRSANLIDGPSDPVPDELFQTLHIDREKAYTALQHVIDERKELLQIASNLEDNEP